MSNPDLRGTFVAIVAAVAMTAAANAQVAPQAAMPLEKGGLAKGEQAKVDQHIAHLHDQLRITPAEQPQWDQFAQVMRDNASQMNDAFAERSGRIATMNAEDDMQSYAQLAQVHAANMQKLAGAFQALYNSFPDQQKQVADQVFRQRDARKAERKSAPKG